MRQISFGLFCDRLHNKRAHYPLSGQIELTYRCNLDCIHCYCKGSEDRARELDTRQWKKILDEIKKEGCVFLGLSGGEPLIRDDFLELYSYAKEKCFVITLFSNGQAFNPDILDYLAKSPPFSIEITLNGITKKIYELITQAEGSFYKIMENIKKIKEKNLPLILKANCLKQNKEELIKIKVFADQFLGKKKAKFNFKYDPMVYPRLNRDKTPTNFRLSFQELLDLRRQDPDIWREYRTRRYRSFPESEKDMSTLYLCTSWMEHFFINPSGLLRFCNFSEKFSVDLKRSAFKDGFYEVFPKLLNEKFKTDSECRYCRLRPICHFCPARADLEIGEEEAPIHYYCELAKGVVKQMQDGIPALQ